MMLLDRSLPDLAEALESGSLRAEELVRAALDRRSDSLDAYQVWTPEVALTTARAADRAASRGGRRAPLAGLPVCVKDLFGVEGCRTWAGTARPLPAAWEREGPVVSELRRQRAALVGKTRMVELAFGGLGNNPHWGTPRNPWDDAAHRVPGGSSSGAGVAIVEGTALVSFCSDTACSARTPAAWTGTVGLKPTQGVWSTDGMVPLSPTLDTVGILTRTVEDACFAFAACTPEREPAAFLETLRRRSSHGTTIGVIRSGIWDACPDDIVAPVRAALLELESGGARLVDVELPEFDEAYDLYAAGHIVGPECADLLARELPEWQELLHDSVGARIRGAVDLANPLHRSALARRESLRRAAAARTDSVDVLAVPTVPMSPPTLDEIAAPDHYTTHNRQTSRGTNPANVLDWCAISIPCGLDGNSMPIGLQLLGRTRGDEGLLAAALACERRLGTPGDRLGRAPGCAP